VRAIGQHVIPLVAAFVLLFVTRSYGEDEAVQPPLSSYRPLATRLLERARAAIHEGDLSEARRLLFAADRLDVNWHLGDDTPQKVLQTLLGKEADADDLVVNNPVLSVDRIPVNVTPNIGHLKRTSNRPEPDRWMGNFDWQGVADDAALERSSSADHMHAQNHSDDHRDLKPDQQLLDDATALRERITCQSPFSVSEDGKFPVGRDSELQLKSGAIRDLKPTNAAATLFPAGADISLFTTTDIYTCRHTFNDLQATLERMPDNAVIVLVPVSSISPCCKSPVHKTVESSVQPQTNGPRETSGSGEAQSTLSDKPRDPNWSADRLTPFAGYTTAVIALIWFCRTWRRIGDFGKQAWNTCASRFHSKEGVQPQLEETNEAERKRALLGQVLLSNAALRDRRSIA
jgi:hypothetical protein